MELHIHQKLNRNEKVNFPLEFPLKYAWILSLPESFLHLSKAFTKKVTCCNYFFILTFLKLYLK